jgi:hypothetical protein
MHEKKSKYYLQPRFSTYWNPSELDILIKELSFVAGTYGGTKVGLIRYKNTTEKVPSFVASDGRMIKEITSTLKIRGTGKWSNYPIVKKVDW